MFIFNMSGAILSFDAECVSSPAIILLQKSKKKYEEIWGT